MLDLTIEYGSKLPKWIPCACLGQFLGYSKDHSSSIDLVSNLSTSLITPHFHMVHDDNFSSRSFFCDSSLKFFYPRSWDVIFQTGLEKYLHFDSGSTPHLRHSWHAEKTCARKKGLGEQVIEYPQDLDSGTVGQGVECHMFQRERLMFQREQENSESLICLSLDREDVLDTSYTSSS